MTGWKKWQFQVGQVLLSQDNNVHQRSKGSNINYHMPEPRDSQIMLLKDFTPSKGQHSVQRTPTLWENRTFHSRAAP